MEYQTQSAPPIASHDLLADLKRLLDSAVREYEIAITRSPTDADEIRRAVDKCTSAREKFNSANSQINGGIPSVASSCSE